MVQPINYMGMIPQPDLARSLASGLQLGTGIREMQQQRVAAEQAQAAKQQLASDVEAARADGSQQAWLGMIAKYPQFREAFGDVRKGLGEEQVKNEFFSAFEVSNALEANQPLIAADRLRKDIAARENSGQDARLYKQALERIEAGDSKRAQSGINEILSVLDPDRFEKTVKAKTTAATAPAAVQKAMAEATKAEQEALNAVATAKDDVAKAEAERLLAVAQADKAKVEADVALATKPSVISEAASKAATAKVTSEFAERKELAALNLNKAQIENYATQQDIARQNARIAVMQADAAKESNALKRQELQLKIETAQEARDQSVRDKYSQAQNVLATFDNTLVSVDKILNNWGKTKDGKIDPNLSNRTVKSATGPVQSRIFTTSQDVADFEEQVGSLESQAFLSQVEKMRGLGALTEREGARLVNALASLSLRQSPKQLAENLLIVRDLMQKARSSAEAKYGDLQSESTAPAAIRNVTVDY
jgi:hypothetical protein